MERVDVSMVYTHVIWYFVFTIYLNTILFAVYSIWTDLKSSGAGREDFIMALLVSLWCGLAYGLWTATERFA
jgi:hypothetical protein